MKRPRWITRKEWEQWVYIVNTTNKGVFEAEFIYDYSSQRSLQIAHFMFKHWNEIKE